MTIPNQKAPTPTSFIAGVPADLPCHYSWQPNEMEGAPLAHVGEGRGAVRPTFPDLRGFSQFHLVRRGVRPLAQHPSEFEAGDGAKAKLRLADRLRGRHFPTVP